MEEKQGNNKLRGSAADSAADRVAARKVNRNRQVMEEDCLPRGRAG